MTLTAIKIKTKKEITGIAGRLKKKGKIVVAMSGTFDIIHSGHIAALREAKERGDALIVLLNSDASVRLYKGPQRPIMPEKERAMVLSAMDMVDYVVLFRETNPQKILEKIKPDIYCVDSEWGKYCVEKETVEKNKGKVYILKHKTGTSTSGIIARILEICSRPAAKAVFLDRDGVINLNKEGHVYKIKDFKFAAGALPGLKKLSKTGYKIIIITNQSGIARGYYKKEDVEKLHKWMLKNLERRGIRIDKIYYCPHHPDDNCPCRKPKIGMLVRAVKEMGVALSRSWLAGDREKDILAGKRANIKTIKVGNERFINKNIKPAYRAENLSEAVKIILTCSK